VPRRRGPDELIEHRTLVGDELARVNRKRKEPPPRSRYFTFPYPVSPALVVDYA